MDISLSDLSSALTANSTLDVDHGFSNTAVVRASIHSDLTLFLCSFEAGGSLQVFFDKRPDGGSGFVSMKSDSYAQCMGSYTKSNS